jgi:hypothetical protein
MMDLSPLNEASDDMRNRLREMIARGDPYFILTGSDPEDKAGCCPSNEVGEANRLARAGILETYGASFNSDCPVTIYAFGGEIHKAQDPPAFTVNQDLRTSVKDRIDRGRTISLAVALRAVLLLLAILSLVAFGVGLFRRFAR